MPRLIVCWLFVALFACPVEFADLADPVDPVALMPFADLISFVVLVLPSALALFAMPILFAAPTAPATSAELSILILAPAVPAAFADPISPAALTLPTAVPVLIVSVASAPNLLGVPVALFALAAPAPIAPVISAAS